MVSTADRIKANAERLRSKPTDAGQPTTKPAQSAVRQRNVRRSVDLSPAAHRSLDQWQLAAAEDLGLARVTGQQVLVALVSRLLSDPTLADQIRDDIAATGH
ncbi:hypothetical protein [Mycobacterium sp. 1274756.6]|uniref:hypothetical protein n=1 Tax=Mycobacterium sp. 1274756.6 TaxID=1834076 RepID=UPI0007FF33A2|nr:hypothetical protein [Mycobacterium sp. 1274756.6]OBJ73872.1 hypothetical protein A5643_00295 [Mycobacterium sp. 1274756.6]